MDPRSFQDRAKADDYDEYEVTLARTLAKRLEAELGEFLHSVVLFGSAAKSPQTRIYDRDIDVLILINDLVQIINPEVVEAYRIIVRNAAAELTSRFHINTMKVTDFWEYVRNGDPLIVNILRDGRPLLDKGVFEPAKAMLQKGLIHPTQENIWTYYLRAPSTITNAKWHVLQGAIDLYWAVIDAAHALLISQGEAPVSPGHVAKLMHRYAKDTRIDKRHARIVEEFHQLSKGIVRREIAELSGAQYEAYRQRAKSFIDEILPMVAEDQRI